MGEAVEAHEAETTLRTHGQRRINLIWEVTQSIIALATIGGGVVIMVHGALTGSLAVVPDTLSNMIFLIVGFYFARTNHSASGGVGPTHRLDERR